jgi:hypothetical protein
LRQLRKAGKLPRMRIASARSRAVYFGLLALCSVLAGCPEKGGGAADKTVAEPEQAEPDDQGKLDVKTKKPAAGAAAPAAAPSAADDKKADDGKDEGGW